MPFVDEGHNWLIFVPLGGDVVLMQLFEDPGISESASADADVWHGTPDIRGQEGLREGQCKSFIAFVRVLM